jgi:hypothetical protein
VSRRTWDLDNATTGASTHTADTEIHTSKGMDAAFEDPDDDDDDDDDDDYHGRKGGASRKGSSKASEETSGIYICTCMYLLSVLCVLVFSYMYI